jgi:hypothetical protein
MFSQGAESDARWKILIVAITSGLISAIMRQVIPGSTGILIGIAFALTLIAAALIFWCRIERKATFKIVGAYFGFCVALAGVLSLLGPEASRR